ncbi:anthranilate synthase component II [Micromonospora schwarzwaldensis]|uniref:anthranilate synthase component II n=1 Tax=Micromonospora sp. DSM 45708 TaxID=3111767 RepID=UPI0031D747C2
MSPRVVVLDNFDSFTYNLVQYLAVAGARPTVLRNTAELHEIAARRPTHLVLSPGPGSVENPGSYGVCLAALAHYTGRIPVLGVCLGHQAIGRFYGARTTRLATVRHGHVSTIRLRRTSRIFAGVPSGFPAMRYHSLAIAAATLPDDLRLVASADDDECVMAVEHARQPVYGVQFHPESIGTPAGQLIIENFLSVTGSRSDSG